MKILQIKLFHLHSFSEHIMKIQILLVAVLAVSAMAEPKPMTKGVACYICKYVIGEIDKLLMDGATLDQIIQAVEQICGPLDSLIPGATAACETLIETQLPQIIDQLVHNQLSPDSVCVFLTACEAPSAKSMPKIMRRLLRKH